MAMEAQVVMFSCLRSAFNTEFKTVPDVSLLLISFHPCLQSMPTCYPCPTWGIKAEEFREKETETDQEWYSDPMYSHFGGYKPKMCLRVDGC